MTIETILIVDDEPLIVGFLEETLKRQRFSVDVAHNGKQALSLLKKNTYDLLLTDMKMPDMNGMEILRYVQEISKQTVVIVMTAYGTIENAVEAMRLGAFHYLLKPFTPETILTLIDKANEHLALIHENLYWRSEVKKETSSPIIVESPVMKKILHETSKIAKSHASVLIDGESGTGKEVIAGVIHAHSLRVNRPFIRVNCAAIPDTLIESEFFGHEKGAFTGANTKHLGRFELADKGTLLLDEITEIPIILQPKLLRAIQEQEFERVGGAKPISVDVRIIATSNRNLKEAISEKLFREDLYYRLNVVPIHLPPLRERREEILPLVHHFLTKFCRKNRQKIKTLTPAAEKKLLSYDWPGNIRELANIMERVVVLDRDSVIDISHFQLD